jgi:hypothetical protein
LHSTVHAVLLTVLFLQENIKTKHPQLLYESKLYKILQGGGKGWGTAVQLYC